MDCGVIKDNDCKQAEYPVLIGFYNVDGDDDHYLDYP